MALFSALQEIAPHLDAAMVLNVCEGADLIVSVRDDAGQTLHTSDALLARLGAPGPEALRYFDEHGAPLTVDMLPHERVRHSGEDVLNAVYRIEGPNDFAWVQMSFTALARGEAGYSVLGIGTDITSRRQAEAVLERMATHDPLTGLLNRAGLLLAATPPFEAARADGSPFAVLLLDVDHFKAVNDHHGHAAGDAVLTAIAAAVRDALPDAALAGRWGGEEFLVACPGAEQADAIDVAEALRAAVAAQAVPLDTPDPAASVRVTASLGVAAAIEPDSSFEALVRRADDALYAAKRDGRDRVAAEVRRRPGRAPAREVIEGGRRPRVS